MPGIEDLDFYPPRASIVLPAGRLILMFVLDTNVVSELRKAKAGKADKNVTTWAGQHAA
jgi:hypothetical protein